MLLKPLLATAGAMTRRQPEKDETTDIAYGRRVANALAGFDVGQSVAICERACVAVEAMEGTDAMLRRAAGAGQSAAAWRWSKSPAAASISCSMSRWSGSTPSR